MMALPILSSLACRPEDPFERSVAALTEISGTRPFELRLSGGYAYAPCVPHDDASERGRRLDCGRDLASRDSNRARRVSERTLLALRKEPNTATAFQFDGIFKLLWATRDEQLDDAVARLERAIALEPHNPGAHSDLALAYVARARRLDRPIDWLRALDASLAAVDAGEPAARFNTAWILDQLAMRHQARDMWRLVEQHDGHGWVQEARAALDRLARTEESRQHLVTREMLLDALENAQHEAIFEAVANDPQRAREHAEHKLFATWAAAANHADHPAAERPLADARAIGRALREVSGDHLVYDAVVAIDAAADDEVLRRALVDGHLALAQGEDAIDKRRFDQAREPLAKAGRLLRNAGSPFYRRADLLLLRCDYQTSGHQAVVQKAARHLEMLPDRYPFLVGRTHWVRGSALMVLGRISEGRLAYQTALQALVRTNELRYVAAVHVLIATSYEEVGDTESAWSHQMHALQALRKIPVDRRLRLAMASAANTAAAKGFLRAAEVMASEAIALATVRSKPLPLANALMQRARLYLHAEKFDTAREDLAAARHWAERIEDADRRATTLAYVWTVEGQVALATDSRAALAHLNRAMEVVSSNQLTILAPPILSERASAHLAAGDREAAEDDLARAIALLETQREYLAGGTERITFLDRARSPFDDLIALLVSEPADPIGALDYAERGRARLLLDWLGPHQQCMSGAVVEQATACRPIDAATLIGQLPDDHTYLVYKALDHTLLIWLIADAQVILRRREIGAASLQAKVSRLTEQLAGGTGARSSLADLYETLVAPVHDLLAPGARLAIVPDVSLLAVPFGALHRRSTKPRFWVEDHVITLVPSLNVAYRLGRNRPDLPIEGDDSLLVIANPATDEALVGDLPRLVAVEREGALVHDLYPRSILLEGSAATPEALFNYFPHSSKLHVAAHSIFDQRRPERSAFVLAPSPESSGLVTVRDLLLERPMPLQLAVLSSCNSSGAGGGSTEGFAGLVWPFLATGTSTVIASIAEVDDVETAELMGELYRHLRDGRSPSEALRRAQLSQLRRDSAERGVSMTWASFALFGLGSYGRAGSI